MRKPRHRGRRHPTEDGKPRILILCEGIRTEPAYFSSLKADFGLTSVRIMSTGTIADVMKRADREMEEDRALDEIWCVLDHDERDREIARFNRWLRRTRRTKTRIEAAVSVPCFEYWLLLHFTFTTRAYRGTGDRSACQQVIRELKRYVADYNKAAKTASATYGRCREHIDTAIERASRVSTNTGGASAADVGKLIERLKRLRCE